MLLWAGQSVSGLGSDATTLVLLLTAIVVLRASTYAAGLWVLFSPLRGMRDVPRQRRPAGTAPGDGAPG